MLGVNVNMRATAVLLLLAVIGSTVQALKIRGSRRRYIVEQPIQNLTPAEKEYFVRLMWLMKHPKNASALNSENNDAELKEKLAHGDFYYDKHVHGRSKESGESYKNHKTWHKIHHHHYGSTGDSNSESNNNVKVEIQENEERSRIQIPQVVHIKDSSSRSRNNGIIGTYDMYSDKYNSSKENGIKNHGNDGPYRTNERPGPYVIKSEEVDSYSNENVKIHHGNEIPFRIKERLGPYVITSDELNSHSRENEKIHHANDSQSRSNERPGPYVIKSHEVTSYSTENEENHPGSAGPPRSNEVPGPYIVRSDEVNNYPYAVGSNDNSSSFESNEAENNIKYPTEVDIKKKDVILGQEIGQNDKNNYKYENGKIVSSSESGSEENRSNSLIIPDLQTSSEEDNRPYHEFKPKEQSSQIQEDHGKFNYDSDATTEIQESIEDIHSKYTQDPENDLVKVKHFDKNKHDSKHKNRYEKRHRHNHKYKKSSELPQFIIKPDLSLDTLRIIPAPRLTSLVIKMCDDSQLNVLDVWKKVARHLGLDNDYTVKNINEVDRLFKTIKTFVALSKKESFLKMPLDRILETVNENISNERDDRSIENYVKNKNKDLYSLEDSNESGIKENVDSPGFFVKTALEPVESPSDSLKTFLAYIFENQEEPQDGPNSRDVHNSLESDEVDSGQLKEFEKRHRSKESSDFPISDELSEDRYGDSIEVPVVNFDKDNKNAYERQKLPVAISSTSSTVSLSPNTDYINGDVDILQASPSPDITISNEPEDLPSANPEENSDINSSDIVPISIHTDDVVSPSLGNSYEHQSVDLPNSDYQSADIRPYSLIPEYMDEELFTGEPILEKGSEVNPFPHENELEVNDNVSVEILSTPSYPISTEKPIYQDEKEPSSTIVPDSSKDYVNSLVTELLGKDASKVIISFLKNYSQCKNPIHSELLQKLKHIIEVLENAECF